MTSHDKIPVYCQDQWLSMLLISKFVNREENKRLYPLLQHMLEYLQLHSCNLQACQDLVEYTSAILDAFAQASPTCQ